MNPSLYEIEIATPGRLCTMARPRGNDWLADEMEALRSSGTDTLVSLLTASEVAELELQAEKEEAERAGLRFIDLPIPDRGTPDLRSFRELLAELKLELQAGKNVVAHCRIGIGRSSIVASGLLISEGEDPSRA